MDLASFYWPVNQRGLNILFVLISLANLIPGGLSISCYTCTSRNGSEPGCEDPINTTQANLTEKCMVPKVSHGGLFIANFCLKIIGKKEGSHERLIIRACALESMDSQCGEFKYGNDTMTGCVLTCDFNGCNEASTVFRYYDRHRDLLIFLLVVKNLRIIFWV